MVLSGDESSRVKLLESERGEGEGQRGDSGLLLLAWRSA